MRNPAAAARGWAGEFRFRDLPRAVWYFLAEDRRAYLAFLGTLLVAMAYEMVPPLLFGMASDFLIGWRPGIGLGRLYAIVAILAASNAGIAIIRLYSKRVIGKVSINTRYRAKVWGFRRLVDFSLAWHQGESAGNKAQRVITGAEAIRDWTGEFIPQILRVLVSFAGALGACLLLSPWFILFFAWYLGGLLAVELWFDRTISRLSDSMNQSIENASGAFVESASNILAVKALGAGESMAEVVGAREESARELSHQRIRLGTRKWMFFQVHNSLFLGLFILVMGYMVIRGSLAPGYVLTYIMYFMTLRGQANEFIDHIQAMIERKSNLGRMMPYFWQDHSLSRGDKSFPADWASIEIREAVFRYKGKEEAIRRLDLSIARGSKVGIAGSSGSGKSTLLKLLLGLYQLESGEIRVGGVPLDEIGHEELVAKVAVVLQETELFNLPLRDNITMLREVEPALFAEALRIACLDELLARLPAGLDTALGEHGYALSGGERQRVGIARAICRDAPILLLDEVTSALDSGTEARVMAGLLGPFARDRTILVVAHRISTLAATDRILVFDRGALVEDGSYESLGSDPRSRFGAMRARQAGA